MKKICVITRHAIVNYGSFLQTYATQKILNDYGYKTIILDYVRKDEDYRNVTELLLSKSKKWNKNFITRTIYRMVQWPDHYVCGRAFEKERKKYLKLSEKISDVKLEKNKIPDADIYCTGSDQVWGEIGGDDVDPVYFLEFANQKAKKISFSASFGKGNYPDERINKFSQLLKNYDKITVREDSALSLVEQAGYSAVQILDPTMIFGGKRWKELTPKIKEKDYVLLYQLNANREMDEYAEKFAKKAGLKLLRVSVEAHNCMRVGKFKWCLSPFEFLSYIKNADYMITDSFHGTAFAIMFNTQFIEVLPKEKIARNLSVLQQFGIENRILRDYSDYSYIGENIEYNSVNKKLNNERKKSKELIKEILVLNE
ncbi:Polysaccharide pyruvyl transferase [Anaerostipes hadrus]|uniref:Polysaccharide pyruvyl transferase n=1 Tax=Anaerostipes hadrus TaxID=649756 RepID=A0A173R9W7_ANAHA|nr:polysaccharide pyruvyl transferase family protein [Anaerostipes hadrus]CUM74693.1 Polysaccharide pyruvyl transferase [Anaerostipes hadrus]